MRCSIVQFCASTGYARSCRILQHDRGMCVVWVALRCSSAETGGGGYPHKSVAAYRVYTSPHNFFIFYKGRKALLFYRGTKWNKK